MAYSATYDADDLDDIGLDIAGSFGAQVISYVAIILIVLLGSWLFYKMRKDGWGTGKAW